MPLPTQLKSARISGASAVSGFPTTLGQLEQALCDILGIPIDTNVTSAIGAKTQYAEITDGNTVTNTSVETALTKNFTIPANTLAAGSIIRWGMTAEVAIGVVHALALKARIGGSTLHTVSLNPPSAGIISIEGALVARTIGAAGVLIPSTFGVTWNLGASVAPVVPVATSFTKDTTGTLVLDFTVQWTTGAPADSVTQKSFWAQVIPAASTS
jgi:hypothetical protein